MVQYSVEIRRKQWKPKEYHCTSLLGAWLWELINRAGLEGTGGEEEERNL
jgi:hypothetical protein